MRLAAIRDALRPGANFVLKSCETGAGMEFEANIANLFARAGFPYNVNIWSPRISINNQIELDSRGNFLDPGYTTRWGNYYFVQRGARPHTEGSSIY
jgi:hypothetical protein